MSRPMPPSPMLGLLNIGGQLFEVDHQKNSLRPYADKPTAEQLGLANSMNFLLPYMQAHRQTGNQGIFNYTPISGSKQFHGVYHLDPQVFLQTLVKDLQIPYTPSAIEPNTARGGWNVATPPDEKGDTSWEIYK